MADKIQRTGEIADGLYILNFGFVCMYLLRSEDGYIGFDTGMRADRVRGELAKLELDAASVTRIVLTHSDSDHVGGLGAFDHPRVFLPSAEVAMIDRTTPRFFGFIYNKPIAGSYETLSDGEQLTLANRTITCIASPGHTVGHMSYLVDGSILIAGDILSLSDGKIVMDRRLINLDNGKRRESIRRIAALTGVRYLCTMHCGYTDDFETAAKDWR